MSKPTLTKLKNFSLLFENPWYGSILNNVVRPIVHGEVVVKNLSNVHITWDEKLYQIRVDQFYGMPIHLVGTKEERTALYQQDMDRTVEQIKSSYRRFRDAGERLYKKLTDCDDIEQALQISNSFLKDGVNVIAVRREEGMAYKFPYQNQMITVTDPEDLFIFLGSLSNRYMMTQGAPDAQWFAENRDESFPF